MGNKKTERKEGKRDEAWPNVQKMPFQPAAFSGSSGSGIRDGLSGRADTFLPAAGARKSAAADGPVCAGPDQRAGAQLLLYLYENTVPAENWEDVAEELLSRLRMAPVLPRSVPLRQWKEEKTG